jgi:serine/threonine protein kinase/formylglycine-generating enzyme required for sulfatase activity
MAGEDSARETQSRDDSLPLGGLLPDWEKLRSSQDPEERGDFLQKLPNIPEQLGDFRLLHALGGGGMGVVYLARQESLDRHVAVKIVRPEQMYFPGALQRFRREVDAVSRLQHPGIVSIHSVGEEDGLPYFAMEHVEGWTLSKVLRRFAGRSPDQLQGADLAQVIASHQVVTSGRVFSGNWAEAGLRLVLEVAEALAHAHSRGILHRDVKPSNIMLTASGRVVLLDFGLARPEGAVTMTRPGSQPGSLPYMSPEQLLDSQDLDDRSDVYSLGVVLYEFLTLCYPFESGSSEQARERILEGRPASLRKHNAAISWDAETVCLTAMDRDPARRYVSAAAMAEDLRSVLELRPIQARRPGLALRCRRWVQRHPTRTAASLVGLLFVAGLFGHSVLQQLQAQRRNQVALAEARDLQSQGLVDQALKVLSGADQDPEILGFRDAILTQINNETEEALSQYNRLADAERLRDLEFEAGFLWPEVPERVPAMQAWLAQAQELLTRLPQYQSLLYELRKRSTPADRGGASNSTRRDLQNREAAVQQDLARLNATKGAEGGVPVPDAGRRGTILQDVLRRGEEFAGEVSPREFSETANAFKHNVLENLVGRLLYLPALMENVGRRIEVAEYLQEVTVKSEEAQEAWEHAVFAIQEQPEYGGLELQPQFGWLPLERDLNSNLWEFWDVRSGAQPQRHSDKDQWVIGDDTGLVFVLLPGGSFDMGASVSGDRNRDPDANLNEGPVHTVKLASFFLSKYEMTQGQWLRLVGHNPSDLFPGTLDSEVTWAHPVESVTWTDCGRLLFHCGLMLPTEAQWEYAARGQTSSRWWHGDDVEGLRRTANLSDHSYRRDNPLKSHEVDWDDGVPFHAPVGSFDANPFGLHDVGGNVYEWCQDHFLTYIHPVDSGTGERRDPAGDETLRCIRGGSFQCAAVVARPSYRHAVQPGFRGDNLGLRPARPLQD